MKITILAVLITFTSFNIDCKEKFEIINATSQDWFGGRKEAGKGTYYELTIVPTVESEKLSFDKIWIGEKYFNISCYQKGRRVKNDTFGAGDTVTITINDSFAPKPMPFVEEEGYEQDPKPPVSYKGSALLSFVYKSKRKYKIIENFTKLENLNYP